MTQVLQRPHRFETAGPRFVRFFSAVIPLLLAMTIHAGGGYTFINVADNTGPLGNSFNQPAINNAGYVVFSTSVGIFIGKGGPLTVIALECDDHFGTVTSFSGIPA